MRESKCPIPSQCFNEPAITNMFPNVSFRWCKIPSGGFWVAFASCASCEQDSREGQSWSDGNFTHWNGVIPEEFRKYSLVFWHGKALLGISSLRGSVKPHERTVLVQKLIGVFLPVKWDRCLQVGSILYVLGSRERSLGKWWVWFKKKWWLFHLSLLRLHHCKSHQSGWEMCNF